MIGREEFDAAAHAGGSLFWDMVAELGVPRNAIPAWGRDGDRQSYWWQVDPRGFIGLALIPVMVAARLRPNGARSRYDTLHGAYLALAEAIRQLTLKQQKEIKGWIDGE